MPDLFDSVFGGDTQNTLSVGLFLLCILIALICGVIYLAAFSFRDRGSRNMRMSLVLLPAAVSVVILMVNGSIGIGVAVAGAFSLVRFRSAPGNAKEISVIFMAMCSGLIAGVGYFAYAVLFSLLMGGLLILLNVLGDRERETDRTRVLKMTVPENLDYTGAFDGVFGIYTERCELTAAKTSNMGSLYRLTYRVRLKNGVSEKQLIDDLRVRNGNLEIMLLRAEENDRDL